jgi:acyl-CoA reductase-like NAD-dependent aldehyde dehydrogenase
VPSTGTGTIEVVNATTEEVIGTIPEGTPVDVDRAVAAAKAAFPGWSALSVEERGKYLQRITEGLQARMQEIASLIAQEVGMPINLSTMIQAGLPTMTFGSMAQVLDEDTTKALTQTPTWTAYLDSRRALEKTKADVEKFAEALKKLATDEHG